MLKGQFQNLLINRICPIPLMFLQGDLVKINYSGKILTSKDTAAQRKHSLLGWRWYMSMHSDSSRRMWTKSPYHCSASCLWTQQEQLFVRKINRSAIKENQNDINNRLSSLIFQNKLTNDQNFSAQGFKL